MSEKNQPHDETQPVRPQGAPEPPAAPRPQGGAAPSAAEPGTSAASEPVDAPVGAPAGAPVGAPAAAAYAPYDPAAAPGPGWGRARRWRQQARGDRAFGLGALIASALAGVIIGGVGTAVFHAVTDDHGPGDRFGQFGPMGDRDGDGDRGRGPMFGGPGAPGGLQPTTPPEDDDSGSSS